MTARCPSRPGAPSSAGPGRRDIGATDIPPKPPQERALPALLREPDARAGAVASLASVGCSARRAAPRPSFGVPGSSCQHPASTAEEARLRTAPWRSSRQRRRPRLPDGRRARAPAVRALWGPSVPTPPPVPRTRARPSLGEASRRSPALLLKGRRPDHAVERCDQPEPARERTGSTTPSPVCPTIWSPSTLTSTTM